MKDKLTKEEWVVLRDKVLRRDKYSCVCCKLRQNLHLHHVQFKSHGGKDTSSNLVTLCVDCHAAVHAYKLFVRELDADVKIYLEFKEGWTPKHRMV